MKRIVIISFQLLMLCLFLGLSSCGGKTKSETPKPQTYIEAVKANDFRSAYAFLDSLQLEYLDYLTSRKRADKYWDAAMYIYKAEMMYILPLKDAEANQRLIYTIQSMNIPGEKPQIQEEYKNREADNVDAYVYFVQRYNRLCDEILDVAIMNGNEEVANLIVKLYEDEYIKKEREVTQRVKKERWQESSKIGKFFGSDGKYVEVEEDKTDRYYKFTRSKESKQNAKQRLKEAREEGAFN